MRRGSGDARVAETAENAKLIIRGWCTEEKVVRCKVSASTAGADVNEKGGSGKGVRPEARRHICMEKKRANAVVESAKDAFCSTVLLRSIGTSETKGSAICGEESANSQVVKLLPVICL